MSDKKEKDEIKEMSMPVTLTVSQFEQLLRAAREVPIDPKAELNKAEEHRARMQAQVTIEKGLRRLRDHCTHTRDNVGSDQVSAYRGTSAVAWILNSDGLLRGVCQRCRDRILPGHKDYERLKDLTTGTPFAVAVAAQNDIAIEARLAAEALAAGR